MTKIRFHPFFALATLLILLVVLGSRRESAIRASPTNPFLWPYNQPSGITFDPADLTSTWNEWKSAQITSHNAGGGGRLRVMGGVNNNSTTSEGMSYGILFASLFDDQSTLDGLWLFARDHLDAQGLMHWHIGNYGQVLGSGAATDGDEDMALGLLNACIKVRVGAWSPSPRGIDYCAVATDLIGRIYQYEVDHPGGSPRAGLPNNPGDELIPGDQWNLAQEYPEGVINLSYFSPGYYTVFGKFTNNLSAWQKVNARNYQITNLAQGKPGNCSRLVPNWNQYDGDPQPVSWQPQNYGWWSWDAARFAWRIAVDRAWYDSANSRETMNEVGGFFSSVGINNVRAQYRLDGTSVDSYRSTFFVANAAAAIWAAPNPIAVNCGAATGTLKSNRQQAYDAVLNTKDTPNSYYGNAWRLFAMLLMTGNFPNFYEMAQDAPSPPATPGNPPTPTPTPPPPPDGALKVQYRAGDSNAGDNQIKPHLRLVNTGTSSVLLSELTVRYWYTNEGNQPQSYWCDWAQLGCSHISGRFVQVDGERYYLELRFASGAGSLAAGANSGEIQNRFAKNDWSSYDESDDYSFDPTKTVFTDWERVTLYRNGQLVWGVEPGGAASHTPSLPSEPTVMRWPSPLLLDGSRIGAACADTGGICLPGS